MTAAILLAAMLATSAAANPIEDPDLARSVQLIGDRLAQTRGEGFDRPPVAVRSPAAMTDIAVEARAYRAVGRERLQARGRAWNDVGLGGPASPQVLWLALARDLPGIVLDPEQRRLLVAPDKLTELDYGVTADERLYVPDGEGTVHELRPPEASPGDDASGGDFLLATGVRPDEPLLAHYLMHLRQLEREGRDSIREKTDELLAAAAWAEGEANVVSLFWLFQGVGLAKTVLTGPVGPADFLDGQLIPAVLDDAAPMDASLLHFVYFDGYDLAIERFLAAGWNVFLAESPASTAELMYPDAPVPDADWPAPVAPREGLSLADGDTLGAHAIFSLVSIWTGSAQQGHNAARSWAADRLLRWENGPDDGLTLWEVRLRSEAAAADFAALYERVVRRRDPETSGRDGLLTSRFREFRIARDGAVVRIEVRAVAD